MIGGQTYPDDFTVIWRGLSIGRIMQASGVPAHLAQWSWSCFVHGKPGASANGNGVISKTATRSSSPHGQRYAPS